MITLKAIDGTTKEVHKGHLVWYSKNYRAALTGNFAEANKTTSNVDLSDEIFQRFVNWLHSGELSEPKFDPSHPVPACDQILLYTPADLVDILALRRYVMNYIISRRAPMPKYESVRETFTHLPHISPMRKHAIKYYITHWTP